MGAAKDILLSKRSTELRKWWTSVVRDERFEQIKLLARSELLDANPTGQDLIGAQNYERILEGLPISEDFGSDTLSQVNPGLHHDLDTAKEPVKKKK